MNVSAKRGSVAILLMAVMALVGCGGGDGGSGDGDGSTSNATSNQTGTTGATTGGGTTGGGTTGGGTTGGGTTGGTTGMTTGGTTGMTTGGTTGGTTGMTTGDLGGFTVADAARACEALVLDPDNLVRGDHDDSVVFADGVEGRSLRRGEKIAIAFHATSDSPIQAGDVALDVQDGVDNLDSLQLVFQRCFDSNGDPIEESGLDFER